MLFLFIYSQTRFVLFFSRRVSEPFDEATPPSDPAGFSLPPAGEIRIAFVLYKHIGGYLSTENASMKLGSEALAANYSVIVNSPVITAAINKDSNKVYLSDPVVFTIRHLQVSSGLFYVLLLGENCFLL